MTRQPGILEKERKERDEAMRMELRDSNLGIEKMRGVGGCHGHASDLDEYSGPSVMKMNSLV